MRRFVQSHNQGFTLIEVVVSLGIMAVILTVSSFGFSFFNSQANLNSTTELLISDFRNTVLSAVNNQQFQDQTVDCWGVYLDTTNNQYTIFADLNNDYLYNDNKEKIRTVELPRKISLKRVSFKGDDFVTSSICFANNSGTPYFDNIALAADASNPDIRLVNTETNDQTVVHINLSGMINRQ